MIPDASKTPSDPRSRALLRSSPWVIPAPQRTPHEGDFLDRADRIANHVGIGLGYRNSASYELWRLHCHIIRFKSCRSPGVATLLVQMMLARPRSRQAEREASISASLILLSEWFMSEPLAPAAFMEAAVTCPVNPP